MSSAAAKLSEADRCQIDTRMYLTVRNFFVYVVFVAVLGYAALFMLYQIYLTIKGYIQERSFVRGLRRHVNKDDYAVKKTALEYEYLPTEYIAFQGKLKELIAAPEVAEHNRLAGLAKRPQDVLSEKTALVPPHDYPAEDGAAAGSAGAVGGGAAAAGAGAGAAVPPLQKST
jgi:hypothetical protein